MDGGLESIIGCARKIPLDSWIYDGKTYRACYEIFLFQIDSKRVKNHSLWNELVYFEAIDIHTGQIIFYYEQSANQKENIPRQLRKQMSWLLPLYEDLSKRK